MIYYIAFSFICVNLYVIIADFNTYVKKQVEIENRYKLKNN